MLKICLHAFAFGILAICAKAETRWCPTVVFDPQITSDGWVQYDDQTMTCLRCSNTSVGLMNTNKLDQYECCGGEILPKGACVSRGGGTLCAGGVKCDGIKQCPDGRDEIGCNVCNQTTQFTCNQHADSKPCIGTDKVCDGTKDCAEGLDETGCEWHGGWCDGFLCGKPHERCIPKSQVCDGTKQCVDGSDEYNCRYCFMQFRCSVYQRADSLTPILPNSANTTTAQCIGSFRVCDGVRDCNNSIDESGCYRWMEWSTWSACFKPFVCTRTRQRSCVNKFGSEVFPSSCYDVEDYHDPNGKSGKESEAGICPECISTIAVPTTSTTSRITASPAVETSATTSPSTSSIGSLTSHLLSASTALGSSTTNALKTSTSSNAVTSSSTTSPSTVSETFTSSFPSGPSTFSSSSALTESLTTSPPTSATAVSDIITTSPKKSTALLTIADTPMITSGSSSVSTNSPSTSSTAVTTSVQTSPPTSTAVPTSSPTSPDASSTDIASATPPQNTTEKGSTPSPTSSSVSASSATTTMHTRTESPPTDTSSGDGTTSFPPSDVPLTESQSSVTEWHNVTSNVTEATTSPRRPLSAVISLSLIISIVVVSALILMAVICSLVFCCSEQRRKRGKWVPRRRYKERREFNVPQMYHDVSLEDVRQGQAAPDNKEEASPKPMKSFVSQTAVDSGIDESNSTTSTLEHGATQRTNLSPPSHASSTLSSTSSRSGSVRSRDASALFRSPSDLPPPPPHLCHNDV